MYADSDPASTDAVATTPEKCDLVAPESYGKAWARSDVPMSAH